MPASDRNAPAALVQAANDLDYSPSTVAGAGTIEDAPVAAAKPPLELGPAPGRQQGAAVRAEDADRGDGEPRRTSGARPCCSRSSPPGARTAPPRRPTCATLANSLPRSKYAFVSIDGNGEDAASVFAYHVYFGLPFPALVDLDPTIAAATFPHHGHAGPGLEGLQDAATTRPST